MDKRRRRISFGKVLIFFSFLLIICGCLFNIVQVTGVTDPLNLHIVNNSDSKVTILTTDKDSLGMTVGSDGNVTASSDNSNVSNDDGVAPSASTNTDNSSNTNSGSSSSSNSTSSQTTTPSNSTTTSTPIPTTPVTPSQPTVTTPVVTIDDTNNTIRNEIYNNYGVYVKYGSETSGYSVGGLSTSVITDSYTINSLLTSLKTQMSLYPSGFFRELGNSIPLTIYLINSYSTVGVCGVTDSNYTRAIMSLANDSDFVATFHHENYHYIERYMNKRGASYTSWASYNPGGFEYGNYNDGYPVYSKTFSPDVYFVNVYSKTDQYEERASIFEYMMASSKASCLNNGKPVYYKAKYICDMMDSVINTCSSGTTDYWERFIR